MEREIWKDVVGFEGYYQVSNMGRFKSVDREVVFSDGRKYFYKSKIITGSYGRDGYIDVKLSKNGIYLTRKLHRLVAIAFIPTDYYEEKEVNHIDYNRANNNIENLEWVFHKDNVRHSSDKGRYKGNTSGIKNGRSQYTEDEVRYIRKLFDEGKTVMDIIKLMFPDLNYNQRKNKWSRMKEICSRETYKEVI